MILYPRFSQKKIALEIRLQRNSN